MQQSEKRWPTVTLAESSLELPTFEELEEAAKEGLKHFTGKKGFMMVSCWADSTLPFVHTDLEKLVGERRMSLSAHAESSAGSLGKAFGDSLEAPKIAEVVQEAESAAKQHKPEEGERLLLTPSSATFKDPPIFFERTLAVAEPTQHGEYVRGICKAAEQAGVQAGGQIQVTASMTVVANTDGWVSRIAGSQLLTYFAMRSANNKGQSYLWDSINDVAGLDIAAVTNSLIEWAKKSAEPSAIEPGYYTVILEPQAVMQLLGAIATPSTGDMQARAADAGRTVFSKPGGGNKIGMQMIDPRASLISDPWDPISPYSPLNYSGRITKRTTFIEKGVLKNLAYDDTYALKRGIEPIIAPNNFRLELEGKTTTVEEMIADTKRGLWIQSLGPAGVIDQAVLSCTGVTNATMFLIEDGKISRPVQNMRWVESPFVMLNKVEAFGPPERSYGDVMPRLKVRDFRFTSVAAVL